MSGQFSYINVIYYCFDDMNGTIRFWTKRKRKTNSIDIEGVFYIIIIIALKCNKVEKSAI